LSAEYSVTGHLCWPEENEDISGLRAEIVGYEELLEEMAIKISNK